MPTPRRTPTTSRRPRPSATRPLAINPDWAAYSPTPIGRDLAARRRWERAIEEEARDLARLPCDDCGHVGLALLARFDRQSGAYRPLAFCPACGEAVEF
jgi:hypothetical protein